MSSFSEVLRFEASTLRVVPSVHYRSPFAERVNYLCRNEATRPDAIAVELGPGLAEAVCDWIRELHSSDQYERRLPCMLALSAPNKRIRSTMRDRAIRLQEETGSSLEELAPEILNKVLGYTSESVVFLSPGDSIIEAIRSAMELGIPVYGVDLEEVADSERREILIEDLDDIGLQDVPGWVKKNLAFAHNSRDAQIDDRREVAMAARLKTILGQHESVLFVCGVAHWQNIHEMLCDDSVLAAPIPSTAPVRVRDYTRLVVHPALAVHFLQPFPSWVSIVERNRQPATQGWQDVDLVTSKAIAPREMLHELIKVGYEKFLKASVEEENGHVRSKRNFFAIGDFINLVDKLAVLENRSVPEISSLFAGARGTISQQFQDVLVEKLFAYDWVDPKQFDLPILVATDGEQNSPMKVEVIDVNGQRGRQFYINDLPGYGGIRSKGKIPCPEDLELMYMPDRSDQPSRLPARMSEEAPTSVNSAQRLRTWNPTDDLLTIMCCRAMDLARHTTQETVSLPFEGALHDGICVKSMIRAAAAGDDRIFVKQSRATPGYPEAQEKTFEPIVWIFDTALGNAEWNPYSGDLSDLRKYCGEKRLAPTELDSVSRAYGGKYVAAMTYGEFASCAPQYQRSGIEIRIQLKGVVYFLPPFCSESEDLVWMQRERFRNVPIVPSTELDSLLRLYLDRFDLNLSQKNWVTRMIGMAVPYAHSSVVVVAPNGTKIDGSLIRYAARHGKTISIVPNSMFPQSVLDRLRKNFAVRRQVFEDARELFDPSALRLLREGPDRYKGLVPKWLNELAGRHEARS